MVEDIRIGSKSIYQDYGFFLETANLGAPVPQESYIKVPGRNGSIDLSEAIAGRITYSDREMVFTFVKPTTIETLEAVRDEVFTDLHGKVKDIFPDWINGYYHGRVTLEIAEYRPNLLRLTANITADPYKYALEETTIELEAGDGVITVLGAAAVVPSITVEEETTITFDRSTYVIEAGTHIIPNIVLENGENDITVSSAAVVKFTEGYI